MDKTCRWCSKGTELIRAHIIPRAFYAAIKGKADKMLVLRPDAKKYTEVSQSGIFDSGILCAECDGLLGKLDEYGLTVFKKPPTDSDLVFDVNRIPVGYSLPCSDIRRAQKFLLSVLWRASVTTHDFFKHVKLGPKYEDTIREIVSTDGKVNEADFEFIVIRFFDNPYDGGLMPPWRGRYPDVVGYNLYLPYYNFIIRADKRQFSDPFTVCRFREGAKPQCLRLPYAGTPESRYIQGIGISLRERNSKNVK